MSRPQSCHCQEQSEQGRWCQKGNQFCFPPQVFMRCPRFSHLLMKILGGPTFCLESVFSFSFSLNMLSSQYSSKLSSFACDFWSYMLLLSNVLGTTISYPYNVYISLSIPITYFKTYLNLNLNPFLNPNVNAIFLAC